MGTLSIPAELDRCPACKKEGRVHPPRAIHTRAVYAYYAHNDLVDDGDRCMDTIYCPACACIEVIDAEAFDRALSMHGGVLGYLLPSRKTVTHLFPAPRPPRHGVA